MESSQQSPAPPATPASSNPAPEQAPIATENQKVITGDPGFGEQQPRQPFANVDTPLVTSSPPPAAQSGTPLPEDRAAAAAAWPQRPVESGDPAPAEPPAAPPATHTDAPPAAAPPPAA